MYYGDLFTVHQIHMSNGSKARFQKPLKLILFDACDLDFDPMTLVLKLDLDIMVTYLHTINEVNKSNGS